jgi:hypothetical protein
MQGLGAPGVLTIVIVAILRVLPILAVAAVIWFLIQRGRSQVTLNSRTCAHCGQRIPDVGTFCAFCGQKMG